MNSKYDSSAFPGESSEQLNAYDRDQGESKRVHDILPSILVAYWVADATRKWVVVELTFGIRSVAHEFIGAESAKRIEHIWLSILATVRECNLV
jgi:hypothetical protein